MGDHAKNEDGQRQESGEHRTTQILRYPLIKTTLVLSLTSIDSRCVCVCVCVSLCVRWHVASRAVQHTQCVSYCVQHIASACLAHIMLHGLEQVVDNPESR